MHKRLRLGTLLLLFSLLLFPTTPEGSAQSPAKPPDESLHAGPGPLPHMTAEGDNLIRLLAGSFDPLVDPLPGGAGIALVDAASLPAETAHYWLVQVRDRQFAVAVAAIEGAGALVAGSVPDDTYVVRATPAQRQAIDASSAVRWTGYYQPAWRMPVAAGNRKGLFELEGEQIYRVYIFRAEPDPSATRSGLEAIPGVQIVDDGGYVIDVRADADAVARIASLPAVEWVAVKPVGVLLNRNARWVTDTGVRDLHAATAPGRLTGAGQTAAVADTGVNYIEDKNGRAHVGFRDCNSSGCKQAIYTQVTPGNDVSELQEIRNNGTNHRKMVAYFDIAASGPQPYDTSSHGTHTAGSVTGDQGNNRVWDGEDGIAPGAKLVHQNVGTESGGLSLPLDSYDLWRQAYRPRNPATVPERWNPDDYSNYKPLEDARTHNNSYGLIVPVVDEGSAAALDKFVWDHEDMVVVVSAGNSGPVPASVGSPATAKNDLTSGASANGRQPMVSIDSMASFSSHGPTGDGRLGVDLATPGQIVVSAKGGSVDGYHVAQGTSMSAPLLTGLATLVREYFYEGYGPSDGKGFAGGDRNQARRHNPSAALVKATLINGAVRMRGYYTGDDGNQRAQDGQWPSFGQGFGLANLDNSLYFDNDPGNNWYHDVWRSDTEAFTITTAVVSRTYQMSVEPGAPFDITLAWTDAPSIASIGTPALVNNLNLVVTGPNGERYVGNNFNSRSNPAVDVATTPAGSAAADDVNNVERVRIANPTGGTYTITVITSDVEQGPQGFALAASGLIAPVGNSFVPGPPRQADAAGSPRISNVVVEPISADTAKILFRTSEPTTATATLELGGEPLTFVDSYNVGQDGYPGLNEASPETSANYANRPVVGKSHEILLTGLAPGETYAIQLAAHDLAGNAAEHSVSHVSPRYVFQPNAADIGQLVENSPGGWRTGTQLYAGYAGGDELLGAFMFRVPEQAVDPNDIVGAYVELVSTHNWVVPYTQDPLFTVDLLPELAEPVWGTQTYDVIADAEAVARAYPETSHLRGAYQRYAFTFSCADLHALRETLASTANGERRAAFRWRSSPVAGTGLFAAEFGFNRRSRGPELRPRLVLFTKGEVGQYPTGEACNPNTPAPKITNLGIHAGLSGGVTVSWETDVAADSLVLFRERGTGEWTRVGSPARTKIHNVQVQGLDPEKRYEFVVRSTACNGASTTDTNAGAGYDFFFRTDPGTRTQHAQYSFESGAAGWAVETSASSLSAWSRGQPGHQSNNGWHIRPYTDQAESSLVSPPVVFEGPQVAIEFFAIIDTEPTYDFLYVEYSADDGATWQKAAALDGMSANFPSYAAHDIRFANPNPGGALKIRFRFASDELVSSPYTGVSVDEVTFASYSKPVSELVDRPGPVPPPSAEASGITPPSPRVITYFQDIAAGTGMCSVNQHFPLLTN